MLASFDAERLAKPIKVLRYGGKFAALWDFCFTCHEHGSAVRSHQSLDLLIRQRRRKSQRFWLLNQRRVLLAQCSELIHPARLCVCRHFHVVKVAVRAFANLPAVSAVSVTQCHAGLLACAC